MIIKFQCDVVKYFYEDDQQKQIRDKRFEEVLWLSQFYEVDRSIKRLLVMIKLIILLAFAALFKEVVSADVMNSLFKKLGNYSA
jgi:hypothetical protein